IRAGPEAVGLPRAKSWLIPGGRLRRGQACQHSTKAADPPPYWSHPQKGEEPAGARAPYGWSFRIFREEYLRGSYVCQVEPPSKPSLLRVPETPPGGTSLTCHTRAGSRLADDTPLAPVSGPSTEPATALAPQTPPHSARVPAQHAASAGASQSSCRSTESVSWLAPPNTSRTGNNTLQSGGGTPPGGPRGWGLSRPGGGRPAPPPPPHGARPAARGRR